jgi:REP element-mobilizing transposase RayT
MEAEFNHLNHATCLRSSAPRWRNFLGHKFWARGYFVTTVGRDEEVIRACIRNQELADRNRLWRFLVKPPALLEVIG